jgi:intein/homing endonuclease
MTVSPEFAEILGLLCAEGSYIDAMSTYWEKTLKSRRLRRDVRSRRIEFYNKDIVLLTHYASLLCKEYGYIPSITKHNKINIGRINIIEHILKHTPLKCKSWRVPEDVLVGSAVVRRRFLRGFFDGDGTASGSLRMFSINQPGLTQIGNILSSLGIEYTFRGPIQKPNRQPYYVIMIRQKSRETFLKLVQPISKIPGLRG